MLLFHSPIRDGMHFSRLGPECLDLLRMPARASWPWAFEALAGYNLLVINFQPKDKPQLSLINECRRLMLEKSNEVYAS